MFENMIRSLFIFLDRIVYWFVEQVYQLFILLSQAAIFTQEDIQNFASRIYVLVGLIMLFRLSFSFVNYIVKPDELVNAEKGGAKLITNVVIVLALLVSTPTIFNEAFRLQNILIKNNVVGTLILGISSENNGTVESYGKEIAYDVFTAFFHVDARLGQCQTAIDQPCIDWLNQSTWEMPGNALAAASGLLPSSKGKDVQYLLDADIATVKRDATYSTTQGSVTQNIYVFDYKFLISTICGGAVVWILLGFCVDLAIRVVKLGFLQLIAPIPIVMSLDPKAGKGGALGKWAKECMSTFASLFVRVGTIYFAIYVISLVASSTSHGVINVITGQRETNFLVNVFVIFGALLFAKQVPKFIEELFGLKGMKMTFNPLKALTSAPLLGGALGAGVALGATAGKMLGRGAWGGTKALGQKVTGGIGGLLEKSSLKPVSSLGSKMATQSERAGQTLTETGQRMRARGYAGVSGAREQIAGGGFGGMIKGNEKGYSGADIKKQYKDETKDIGYGRGERKERRAIERNDKLGKGLFKQINGEHFINSDKEVEWKNGKTSDFANRLTKEKNKLSNSEKEKIETEKSQTKFNALFRHQDFSNKGVAMETAKRYRDASTAAYETLQNRVKGGEKVDLTEVEKARVASLKAGKAFDAEKQEFDAMRKVYKADAKRYDAYDAYDTQENNRIRAGGFYDSPTKPTPPPSGGSDETPRGSTGGGSSSAPSAPAAPSAPSSGSFGGGSSSGGGYTPGSYSSSYVPDSGRSLGDIGFEAAGGDRAATGTDAHGRSTAQQAQEYNTMFGSERSGRNQDNAYNKNSDVQQSKYDNMDWDGPTTKREDINNDDK